MRLTPSAFFDAELRTEELQLDYFGGTVLVRGLSAADQDDYEIKLATGQFSHGYRSFLAYHCVVNDDGSLFFEQERDGKNVPADEVMQTLSRLPWGVLDTIATAAGRLSGLPELNFDTNSAKKKSDDLVTDDSGE